MRMKAFAKRWKGSHATARLIRFILFSFNKNWAKPLFLMTEHFRVPILFHHGTWNMHYHALLPKGLWTFTRCLDSILHNINELWFLIFTWDLVPCHSSISHQIINYCICLHYLSHDFRLSEYNKWKMMWCPGPTLWLVSSLENSPLWTFFLTNFCFLKYSSPYS